MTYVYNSKQSDIKREATPEEIKIVRRQGLKESNLYKEYQELLSTGSPVEALKNKWDEYQNEYKEYNRLFCLYLGYVY